MRQGIGVVAVIAAVALPACGYPDFSFSGTSGTGGQGTTASTTSATSATGTGGSAPLCPVQHLLISQVRTRGSKGASDEFVELYNPMGQDVVLDDTWSIVDSTANATGSAYAQRWKGTGKTIRARGHFLIAGTGYVQAPAPDELLSNGITDAASLVLKNNGGTIGALCYYNDSILGSKDELENLGYTCEGTPVQNPHDDMNDTNFDESLDRKAAGGAPQCSDTADNASDFAPLAPAAPHSSSG